MTVRPTLLRRAAAAGTALLCAGLTGCGVLSGGVYDAPLPGGADVGDDPIHLTVEFEDALDLVPQSSVKVDNVAVGRVTEVTLADDGRSAVVELEVRGDLDLPASTTARLQQTSLLGEKYVALVRPEGARATGATAGGTLSDGASLDLADSDAAATAEQVLGALSLVLNGGGIGQFQEISRELQQVGDGRTGEIRSFLREMDRFVGVLDRRRGAITGAIDGLARLSTTLDGDREQIATVLEDLSPGMEVLVDQRPQLTRMLTALDRLSKVTVRTLKASQKDMVRDFELLEPILRELAEAGTDLPYALEILLTYPFPDSVLGAIRGDYLNVFMTTNFRTLPAGCAAIGCWWPQSPAGAPGARSGRTPHLPEPPPAMLPPTDSAAPGLGTPTTQGPSIRPSEGGLTGSPSGSTGTPSDSASSGSTDPTPSESDSPRESSAPGESDGAVPEGGE